MSYSFVFVKDVLHPSQGSWWNYRWHQTGKWSSGPTNHIVCHFLSAFSPALPCTFLQSACFYTFARSLKVFLVGRDEPNWAERHQFIQKVKKCTFKGRHSAPVIKKHITSCDFDIPGWIFLHVMSTLSPFISCLSFPIYFLYLLSLTFIIHTCAFPTVTCRNVQFSTYTGRHPICIYLWDTYVKPSWTVVFVLARCTY